jgi:hypothetical protein
MKYNDPEYEQYHEGNTNSMKPYFNVQNFSQIFVLKFIKIGSGVQT